MYNGEMGYNHLANNSLHISAHGWRRFQYLRLTQKLPWNLTGSFSVYESGSFTDLYSRTDHPSFWDGVNYSLSLRRSFLKEERLTVSVMANNIGLGTQKMRTTMFNSGISGETINYINMRQFVVFGVSYRFGSLNASVKKTAKSITNDDLVGRKQ